MNSEPDSPASPPRFSGKEDEPLAAEARHIVRTELDRLRMSYKDLAEAMGRTADGPIESPQTLTNKINRGRFSFAFFLRVCRAMGVTHVEIPKAPVKSNRRN